MLGDRWIVQTERLRESLNHSRCICKEEVRRIIVWRSQVQRAITTQYHLVDLFYIVYFKPRRVPHQPEYYDIIIWYVQKGAQIT